MRRKVGVLNRRSDASFERQTYIASLEAFMKDSSARMQYYPTSYGYKIEISSLTERERLRLQRLFPSLKHSGSSPGVEHYTLSLEKGVGIMDVMMWGVGILLLIILLRILWITSPAQLYFIVYDFVSE